MQLTSIDTLSPDKIIFKDAKEYQVKDSKLKYKRIKIETVYPDGKKGDLVIETPFLFSFGVNEKRNQETGKLVGYSIPICLWAKDSEPNHKEQSFFEAINNITTICQQHLENEYGADLASSLSSLLYYNRLNILTKRVKRKLRETPQLRQFSTQNLFILKNQRKFFLYFRQRVKRVLRASFCKYRRNTATVSKFSIFSYFAQIKPLVSYFRKYN